MSKVANYGFIILTIESHHENILILPYSDSEEEQEEDATLALQIVPVS